MAQSASTKPKPITRLTTGMLPFLVFIAGAALTFGKG
jgi:hypothetical protein